jgi:hypothetical protein
MGGRGRYDWHLVHDAPATGAPNDPKCETCTEPSKTHYIGGKTVDGIVITRFECANGHKWTTRVPVRGSDPGPRE